MTKTVLITGGSRGIGKATADLLRGKEWEVVAPPRDEYDMNSSALVANWHDRNPLDRLDALIFCHGVWFSRPLQDQFLNHYSEQYQIRVIAPLGVIKRCLPIMADGVVVTVSSTRGFIGGVDTGPYALACAAQIAMMQGYAREYAGVRFNCVCPGLTDTDMGQDVIRTGGAKPGAPMQPPGIVAAEIVRLIESNDNGRVMRVVNSEVSEAKWSW